MSGARSIAAIAASLLLLGVATARADDSARAGSDTGDSDTAAETFRSGQDAFARKDYRAAALAFELSNRLSPHGVPIYNAGLAWEAAAEVGRSADALRGALATNQLSDSERADAEERLAKLRKSLGRIHVTGPRGATASVAHVRDAKMPVDVHVAPGTASITVTRADGSTETKTAEVTQGGDASVDFPEPPKAKADPIPQKPPPPEDNSGLFRALGIAGLALGVAGAGAAIGVGVVALDARDRFEASGRTDVAAHDEADTMRTVSNASVVAASVFGAVGAALLVTSFVVDNGSASSQPAAGAISIDIGPTWIGAHGAF